MIGIHHCPVCACLIHWQTLGEDFGKMGVNARLLDGFDTGADPQPGRCWIGGDEVEVRTMDNR